MNKRPGGGFLLIIFTYSFVFLFLHWGFSKPELERVWEIYHELKLGKINSLGDKDMDILSRSLQKYPALATELLKGKEAELLTKNYSGLTNVDKVTILRSSSLKEDNKMQVKARSKTEIPIEIILKGNSGKGKEWLWKQKKNLVNGKTFFLLPATGKHPEIMELSLSKKNFPIEISFLKTEGKMLSGLYNRQKESIND